MSGSSARMRAVQICKFGAPEVLRAVLAVIPSPGSAQVLGRLHAARSQIRTAVVFADVRSHGLAQIGELFDADRLRLRVGPVAPLNEARRARGMLESHLPISGKIVLNLVA